MHFSMQGIIYIGNQQSLLPSFQFLAISKSLYLSEKKFQGINVSIVKVVV